MTKLEHQWGTYRKGKMRTQACVCCGALHLPSNSEKNCNSETIMSSVIIKAGYSLCNTRHMTMRN